MDYTLILKYISLKKNYIYRIFQFSLNTCSYRNKNKIIFFKVGNLFKYKIISIYLSWWSVSNKTLIFIV